MSFFPKKSDALGAIGGAPHNGVSNMSMSPTTQFVSVCGIGLAGLVLLNWLLFGSFVTPGALSSIALYVSGCAVALIALRRTYPHSAIGFCNCVTIVRLMLVGTLVAALIDQYDGPWTVFVVASIALSLDGLDGWFARREGYTSHFGASFDMEVDSALALTLALHGAFIAGVGPYVILLGLPRYLLALAQFPFAWLGGDLPPRFSRKVVCVLQLLVLIVVLLPMVQPPVSDILVGVAVVALAWSFWLDVQFLRRARS